MVSSWSSAASASVPYSFLRPAAPPPPPPPAAVAPSPAGDSLALSGWSAPRGGSSGTGLGPATPIAGGWQDPVGLRQALNRVFQDGVAADLASPLQARKLDGYLAQMQPGQLESLKGLLNAALSKTEQVFVLKAFAANEPWPNLVQYAAEMRGLPEADVIHRSTMRDDRELVQQWQDACGPAMLQVAAGEADPRFAWELNKTFDLAAIDPLGANVAVAEQQKQWLETYGGRAVPRGQGGGTGIAIGQMLNDMLTPITGASYQTVEATDKAQALDQVALTLQGGLDVPLRVVWNPPGVGPDYGHFVLALAVRQGAGGREFQIHDPWNGRTAWVPEPELLAERMPPMFGNYARLTHIYPGAIYA